MEEAINGNNMEEVYDPNNMEEDYDDDSEYVSTAQTQGFLFSQKPTIPPIGGGVEHNTDIIYKKTTDGSHIRAWGVTFPFKGIGFLGRGYNIWKGNPKATGVGGDKGFREKVFVMDTSAESGTDDWQHVKPKNVEVYTRTSCSLSFSSQTVDSSSTLQSSMDKDVSTDTTVGVSVSFEGYGANFAASFDGRWSASQSFKSMSSTLAKKKSLFIISEAKCSLYEARIQKNMRPEFSQEFTTALKALPDTYVPDKYVNFLEAFGSHVLTGALFGSKYGKIFKMEKTSVEQLQSQGVSVKKASELSVKASGGYDGFGADVQASGSVGVSKSQATNDQKKAASAFNNAKSSEIQYSIGALPPANGDAKAWAAAVENESPMPIHYELEKISSIVALVDSKKASFVEQAFKEYEERDPAVVPPIVGTELGKCRVVVRDHGQDGLPIRSLVSPCGNDANLIGGGSVSGFNLDTIKTLTYQNAMNWAFPSPTNSFIYGSGLQSVKSSTKSNSVGRSMALCCNSEPDVEYFTVRSLATIEADDVVQAKREATVQATCPTGYFAISGGFANINIDKKHFADVVENYRASDTKWECKMRWTGDNGTSNRFACYARCVRSKSKKLKCRSITSTAASNKATLLKCPVGLTAAGLGWKVITKTPAGSIYHISNAYVNMVESVGPTAGLFEIGSLAKNTQIQYQATCCDLLNENFESDFTDQALDVENCVTVKDKTVNCLKVGALKGFVATSNLNNKEVSSFTCCPFKQQEMTQDIADNRVLQNNLPSMSFTAQPGWFINGFNSLAGKFFKAGFGQSRPMVSPLFWKSCYVEEIATKLAQQQQVMCRKGYRIVGFTASDQGNTFSDFTHVHCCEFASEEVSSSVSSYFSQNDASHTTEGSCVRQDVVGNQLKPYIDSSSLDTDTANYMPITFQKPFMQFVVKATFNNYFNSFSIIIKTSGSNNDGKFYRIDFTDTYIITYDFTLRRKGAVWRNQFGRLNNPHPSGSFNFWIKFFNNNLQIGLGSEIGQNKMVDRNETPFFHIRGIRFLGSENLDASFEVCSITYLN